MINIKTINIELSKKLEPYLENIETEYRYRIYKYNKTRKTIRLVKNKLPWDIIPWDIKTLKIEEAIEFILSSLTDEDSLQLWNNYICVFIKWELVLNLSNLSLLQAMEKILEYLFDNDLLWTQK